MQRAAAAAGLEWDEDPGQRWERVEKASKHALPSNTAHAVDIRPVLVSVSAWEMDAPWIKA